MSKRLAIAPTALFLFLLSVVNSQAQETWGVNGAGGSGSWDTSTANWWNGAQNVAWPSGGDAIFAGPSGTVSSFFSGPVVNSITFNTPGYVIQNGWLQSGSNGLTIKTNADATISSTLSYSTISGNSLIKTGSAALTVSGVNFLGSLQVDQGEYRVGGSSDLFFSNVTLAKAAGVTVTLGQSATSVSMNSLSGGGEQGGIVQPDTQARR